MSKVTKKSGRVCQICCWREYYSNTATTVESTHRFFARFPLDEDRCREWVRVTGNEDLIHLPIEKLYQLKFVCGDHFERKYFNKKGNRLKSQAIPTLKLISVPLNNIQLAEFPQHMFSSQDSICKNMPSTSKENNRPGAITAGIACTTSDKAVTELTPRKKKLVEQLKKTRYTLKSLRASAVLLEKIESPVLRQFVINASKNDIRNPKGRRWTTQH